ncbi:PEP-CTERM sorting domain-containing protein [Roseomonas sp. SSH11]|uniref:PEP-CTERM sorting domain-containing protein n=1 Tax=Pararoseomonas baculiformis TaxID=2820812 RepID=A0ABS4ACD9_9PROT|nr:PEP-CTERM sorting domain-containing protein [Pararoseomonas baculiformis]MBP0444677.1 PEP-CTERM sorting domain-containing protein [Pararoseomonas baculiformis]
MTLSTGRVLKSGLAFCLAACMALGSGAAMPADAAVIVNWTQVGPTMGPSGGPHPGNLTFSAQMVVRDDVWDRGFNFTLNSGSNTWPDQVSAPDGMEAFGIRFVTDYGSGPRVVWDYDLEDILQIRHPDGGFAAAISIGRGGSGTFASLFGGFYLNNQENDVQVDIGPFVGLGVQGYNLLAHSDGPLGCFESPWCESSGIVTVTRVDTTAVPEPASAALLCMGLLGLAGVRRRFT